MRIKYLILVGVLIVSTSASSQTLWVPSGTSGIGSSGTANVGIGISSPSGKLHVVGSGVNLNTTSSINGDVVVAGSTGGRTTTSGAQLEFVIPANTDGSNMWGQGRIITVAGNTSNGDATGKMILGIRRYIDKLGSGQNWYYGDDITISGGNGDVTIGSGGATLSVYDNIFANGYISSNGYISGYGIYDYSDARLKENIVPITNGLSVVKSLSPKEYTFKKGLNPNIMTGKESGLIAQEVQKVLPHIVRTLDDKNSSLGINYRGIIPYLISALQEQQKIIDEQSKAIEKHEVLIQNMMFNNSLQSRPNLPNALDWKRPKLFDNVPNPSSNDTEIKYSVPDGFVNVSLFIYNLSGEQITKFDNLKLGEQSVTITKGTLKAGMYIYSLVTDGQVRDSKKMVIID